MQEVSLTPIPRSFNLVTRALMTIAGGFGLFFVGAVLIALGFSIRYSNKIYPGLSIGGIGVSGKTPPEALAILNNTFRFPVEGKIYFQDGTAAWAATPTDLGVHFDAGNTVQKAYDLGRSGNPVKRIVEQFDLWYRGRDIPFQLNYDEGKAYEYLIGLGNLVNRPTVEAQLGIDGINIVVNSGQIGRTLDIPATLAQLEGKLQTLNDILIQMVIYETPPVILDATEQAEIARKIISEPLIIRNPDGEEGEANRWRLEPETLAGMLAIERIKINDTEVYRVGLSANQLRDFLNTIAPQFTRTSQNTRFIFNDDTHKLEVIHSNVIGRELLIQETIDSINQNLADGKHRVNLEFKYTPPEITDEMTGSQLGITELVSAQTSYFYGSSSSRIQNIATAASRFHGVLVAPGAQFSMASTLGDVSLDTGFAEALIIFGDRTIKGVGGGVCQVSTTLFRTVFFGGYQIDERYPHAYRVYYYELAANGSVNSNLAGLDATVFVPMVDFKFTNDSPYWLLMETYVNPTAHTLTWKFYSTLDGRTVEWSSTGLKNKVEAPEPLYQENPDLAKGEIKQVDWEVAGADVQVIRTVSRNGSTIHEDIISTHYQPWRAVFEYGPGTKIPKDKNK